MTSQSAHGAVTTSALIVGGVFMYRHFAETAAQQKTSATTDQFLLGWMVVYLTLSVTAEVAPAFGAMFAWLIALGDLLINGQGLITAIDKGLGVTAAATK
jgi:hypothetical protein